jgi:hypothetical protein
LKLADFAANLTHPSPIINAAAVFISTRTSHRPFSKSRNQKFTLFLSSQNLFPSNHKHHISLINMKSFAAVALLAGSASGLAFNFGGSKKTVTKTVAKPVYSVDTIPGALDPVGLFDPLGLAAKANEGLLKRYREAELTHGRVAMLAAVGFLVGEQVEGSSFLFDASVSGPAITHLTQVPGPFWITLLAVIGFAERKRLDVGWVEPENTPLGQAGLLRESYFPGDIGFDPLNLKPTDPAELLIMQTKELQNGRLAMLAAAGFLAQELVDHKGIIEHFSS